MAANRPVNVISGTTEKQLNSKSGTGGKPKGNKHRTRNETYMEKLENAVSLSSKRKIESILTEVNNLGDVEKMLLYLRLPTGFSESDVSSFTKSPPSVPNSSREEHTKAYNWICSHLEESPDTSMPKQDVYEEYKTYCDNFKLQAVCPADFGKIMKGVFPNMKRRRLGTRGNSRYCYSGIRKKTEMKSPALPHLDLSSAVKPCHLCPDHQVITAAAEVVCSWEKKSHSKDFPDIIQCAQYLIHEGHVPKESDPAKVFISALEECDKAPKLSRLDQNQDAWLQRSPEERRRETQHQLQMKLQQNQLKNQLRKEEERKKSFGVQVCESGIDNSEVNSEQLASSTASLTKDGTEAESSEAPQVGGNSLVSPVPGTSASANLKESPKKKLTPIQPKTPLRNQVCFIPVPFQPKDNEPLKLVYVPATGKQFAIPARMNIQGTQPLPGSSQALIPAQACQNTVQVGNKLIVPVPQVQIQAAVTKPATSFNTNGQVVDQQGTSVSLQGAKVKSVPQQRIQTVSNQWPNQSKVQVINQGITLTVSEGALIGASQGGVTSSVITTETQKVNQNLNGGIGTSAVLGVGNNQKHAVIVARNKQSGIISVQQTQGIADLARSPDNGSAAGKVSNEMVVVPSTPPLSSNIPPSAMEVVIAQSNPRGQGETQPQYVVTKPLQSTPNVTGKGHQLLPTSVANMASLEALFTASGSSQAAAKIGNSLDQTVTMSNQGLSQLAPMLTRGNSSPASLSLAAGCSTSGGLQHGTRSDMTQSASQLLRCFSESFRGNQGLGEALSQNEGQAQVKEAQPKSEDKQVKQPSRLEELLREPKPLPATKSSKSNTTARRNSQARPKSVARMLDRKGVTNDQLNGSSSSGNLAERKTSVLDGAHPQISSALPSLSINKPKSGNMPTVSGMSEATMLPSKFRGKTEGGQGESPIIQTAQQGNNQLRVQFPQQSVTLIAQDVPVSGGMNQKLVMRLPNTSQSQLLNMLQNSNIAASPSQVTVGSPAPSTGQLSAPSTPLANLGSPEAVISRSANNTPMSDVGSVPASPAQQQQAQLFFVPINQGQLDPALISNNNKSPVKPKHRPVFFSNQHMPLVNAIVGNTEAATPLDLTLSEGTTLAHLQTQGGTQINVGSRKRHHSGDVLSLDNTTQDSTTFRKQGISIPANQNVIGNIGNFNTITDMPPPSSLPHGPVGGHAYLRGGKPLLTSRLGVRGNTASRKRNVSGPSISVQAVQQQISQQQTDMNIPSTSSCGSSNEATDRERNLAKRSRSVPLPELSESLKNFIISTDKGGCTPAKFPEEIEKSLKYEPTPRGVHLGLNSQFGAKRNLTTELEGMGSDQDQREQSADAMFNAILNNITGKDESESGRQTHHLVGSTGSGNCASSHTEIVPNAELDRNWTGLLPEDSSLVQPVMTLEDNASNSSLELQGYSFDNFVSTSSLELMQTFPASVSCD